MEPHSQAALAEGPAGRPWPPVPLDAKRRGHPVGRAGEGLATMAGVDAGEEASFSWMWGGTGDTGR